MALSPWEIEWTSDRISSFWNAYSRVQDFSSRYFSRMAGHSVVRELRRYAKHGSTVLDFGAGKGYLTRHLLTNGYKTIAVDTSEESIQALEQNIQHHPNFLRAEVLAGSLPIDSESVDAILFVEVIEHLNSSDLTALLEEFKRVLKPRGILFVTTPNEENLGAAKQMCPHCGCIFHPVQHLRSFTPRQLANELHGGGFRILRCRTTYFSHFRGVAAHIDWIRHILGPDPWPNLFAVAQKS